MKDLLDAHIPPGGRLGRGHKGLYDTINNSLHFQLGLALASYLKYLEFLFVYYMDDPIRKDHDWELFDRLSLWKSRNRINLNSGLQRVGRKGGKPSVPGSPVVGGRRSP
ncbi:hypothetical protein R3W88_023371 [Solanum pinnatisectum]|uniref:Ycf2 N-terminal domain-containing protein n=1 Tax=Solanum pinnatisectum TaxID=50273 RepID=A0AAV9LY49_9SOLN|nr:hypothetical protein R3W88_023371 [Solanum pinnatisectum]